MATTPEPPDPQEPPNPPGESKEYSLRLNRDDRIRVLALRDAGFTYMQISQQLHITYRQVQYTC